MAGVSASEAEVAASRTLYVDVDAAVVADVDPVGLGPIPDEAMVLPGLGSRLYCDIVCQGYGSKR